MIEHLEQIKRIRNDLLQLCKDADINNISPTNGKVLITNSAFKKLAKDIKYNVILRNNVYFYEIEIDDCIFVANNKTPLFENDEKLLQEQEGE